MVPRGRRPTPTAVKHVLGNPGNRPLSNREPAPKGRPRPPVVLTGRPLALWRRYISTAFWLTAHDSPMAWLWVQLHAEAEQDPARMTAARIGQLRALASSLGLDPSSRSRMGGDSPPAQPGNRFF